MVDTPFAMQEFWPIYWDIRRRGEWPHRRFDAKKAYLACMLAELAYMHLPEHEVDQWRRMKLFPCMALELAVASGPLQVSQALFAALAGERMQTRVYVVQTRHFVSIAIVIDEVVLIASRGTADAYDLRIDFDFLLVPPLLRKENLRMHRGFLGEALKHADLIANELALDENKKGPTIYATGHSLGGALAAILNALYSAGGPSGRHYRRRYYDPDYWTPLAHLSDWFHIDSCYSFGMPRYSEHTAVHQLPNAYSIIRPLDPIIYLPSRKHGYADSLREYGTDLAAGPRREREPSKPWLRSLKNVATLRGWMAEHKCELYRSEIASTLKMPHHPLLLPVELLSAPSRA
jgi:hypothetical protein